MNKDSSFTVRDLPRPERPRERLQKFGPVLLSLQELLAPRQKNADLAHQSHQSHKKAKELLEKTKREVEEFIEKK